MNRRIKREREREIQQAVLKDLRSRRLGASEAVIARSIRVPEHEVLLALGRLLDDGRVRTVRTTKTSTVWGVVQ